MKFFVLKYFEHETCIMTQTEKYPDVPMLLYHLMSHRESEKVFYNLI